MNTTLENITPEIAADMLSRNASNRPINPGIVGKYAYDMRNGLWNYNGQDILIDSNGNLLDGQHRLRGVVVSGVPTLFGVKRGLPPEVFVTIDSGKPRSAGDVIAILRFENYNTVAGAARLAMLYDKGINLTTAVSRRELTEYAASEPYLPEAVRLIGTRKVINRTPFAAVLYLGNRARRYDTDVATFVEGVGTGANLELGDPRLALRNWAINERARSRNNIRALSAFSATARAWTAWAKGDTLRYIKLVSSPSLGNQTIAGYVPIRPKRSEATA